MQKSHYSQPHTCIHLVNYQWHQSVVRASEGPHWIYSAPYIQILRPECFSKQNKTKQNKTEFQLVGIPFHRHPRHCNLVTEFSPVQNPIVSLMGNRVRSRTPRNQRWHPLTPLSNLIRQRYRELGTVGLDAVAPPPNYSITND